MVVAFLRTAFQLAGIPRPTFFTEAGSIDAAAAVGAVPWASLDFASNAMPALIADYFSIEYFPMVDVSNRAILASIAWVANADAFVALPIVGTFIWTGGDVASGTGPAALTNAAAIVAHAMNANM